MTISGPASPISALTGRLPVSTPPLAKGTAPKSLASNNPSRAREAGANPVAPKIPDPSSKPAPRKSPSIRR